MLATVDIEKLRQLAEEGFDRGLIEGQKPCVMAAVSLASGEGWSDHPSCVHPVDRLLAVRLNDCLWPTPKERAKCLLPLAIAAIGTNKRNRRKWAALVVGNIDKWVSSPSAWGTPFRDLFPWVDWVIDSAKKKLSQGGMQDAMYDVSGVVDYIAREIKDRTGQDSTCVLRDAVRLVLDAYREEKGQDARRLERRGYEV